MMESKREANSKVVQMALKLESKALRKNNCAFYRETIPMQLTP